MFQVFPSVGFSEHTHRIVQRVTSVMFLALSRTRSLQNERLSAQATSLSFLYSWLFYTLGVTLHSVWFKRQTEDNGRL
jgi:hypothetical protein